MAPARPPSSRRSSCWGEDGPSGPAAASASYAMASRRSTVFGRTDDQPPQQAGIEISADGGTRARINGENAASLARALGRAAGPGDRSGDSQARRPGPRASAALAGLARVPRGTKLRSHWARYSRALKQRNAALRSGAGDIGAWDAEMIRNGEAMTQSRHKAPSSDCATAASGRSSASVASGSLTNFMTGWAAGTSLEDPSLPPGTDRARGTTTSGPHRAELTLRRQGRIARETLSRGQQKLTAVAMIVAQMQLLQDELGLRAVLLLDDPAAELDETKSASIVRRTELTSLPNDRDFADSGDRAFSCAESHVSRGTRRG